MLVSGFIAVLVGYSSSAAIIFQAAQAAGASSTMIGGWLSMLGIAMGLCSLGLSLWTRMPILCAWSTPGAALLATSLHGLSINEAIGVFIFANALIALSGVTGLFARLMNVIPPALASAMLAGILLRFGLEAFTGLQSDIALCGAMLLSWLLARRWLARYAILAALAVGVASVASFARLARGEVVRIRHSDYVEAAFGSGGTFFAVLRRHILPNALTPVIAFAALQFGQAILALSTLSFLGYGTPPPAPEWGLLIAEGRNYLSTAWWLTTFPGMLVIAVVLAANRISIQIAGGRR